MTAAEGLGLFSLGILFGVVGRMAFGTESFHEWAGRMTKRLPSIMLVMMVVVVVIYSIAVIGHVEWAASFFNLSFGGEGVNSILAFGPLAVGVSAVVALTTFMISQKSAKHNNRRQHTISLLFQNVFGDKVYQDKRVSFIKNHGNASLLDENVFNKKSDLYSDDAIYLLNYYENVAAAIHFGDLDEELVRTTIGASIMVFVSRSADFICSARTPSSNSEGADKNSAVEQTKYFEHIVCLYADWYDTSRRDLEKFFRDQGEWSQPVLPDRLKPVSADRRAYWQRLAA